MLALDVNGTPVGKHFVYPLRRDFFFYTTSCAYNEFNFVDQGLDFNGRISIQLMTGPSM